MPISFFDDFEIGHVNRLAGTVSGIDASSAGRSEKTGSRIAIFREYALKADLIARLGFHQGFGLSETLPALVGQQRAAEMLYTGQRLKGEEAAAIGMIDYLVPLDQVRARATELAAEIAASAPLAVRSIRQTMRGDLADRVKSATDHEGREQERLRSTNDFKEGTKAMGERRTPNFTGS